MAKKPSSETGAAADSSASEPTTPQQAPACQVRALGAPLRRAGFRFHAEPTCFGGEFGPALTDEQRAAIEADPGLIIEPVPADAVPQAAAAD